ncbi:hypothetical protein PG993_015016 [Apiospora rasikravindrae]|uniref:Uncharacterized protein n=1 Tax=Apiospora rasikravindrae TaxID=990691 RepID=A0ABR1RPP6_9PEZI
MPSQSGTSSSSQTYKIETVKPTKRKAQKDAAEPDASDSREFVRRGSYYETGVTDQPECTVLQASDVRRQVQEAPKLMKSVGKYPGHYNNNPPLPLSANKPYREFPVVPSPAPGRTPQNYRGGEPGPIRAFYNEQDRSHFDVAYKDATKPPRGPRNGSPYPNSNFSLATYHAAPTVVDTSKSKKAKK